MTILVGEDFHSHGLSSKQAYFMLSFGRMLQKHVQHVVFSMRFLKYVRKLYISDLKEDQIISLPTVDTSTPKHNS